MNTSNTTIEFPPWRQLTAVNILLYFGVLLSTTLVMNISVLIALIKSKVKYKPLLVLFGSLLITVCIEKLIVCIGQCVLSPNTYRYCLCDKLTVLVFQVPRIFFATYTIIIVTCLSITQLCLMKGKPVNDCKLITTCLVISVVFAIMWALAVFVGNILTNDPPYCYVYCTVSPFGVLRVNARILISLLTVTLIPGFVVTIVASILALQMFKKNFIVRPDSKNEISLNRRMLFLPFVMALLQICNSVVSYFVTIVSGTVLWNADLGDFYGNIANIFGNWEYLIFDILHGLSFPLALLYLYSNVRKTWKKVVCKLMRCHCADN